MGLVWSVAWKRSRRPATSNRAPVRSETQHPEPSTQNPAPSTQNQLPGWERQEEEFFEVRVWRCQQVLAGSLERDPALVEHEEPGALGAGVEDLHASVRTRGLMLRDVEGVADLVCHQNG